MPFSIRRAKEKDYEAICLLQRQLKQQHYEALPETYRKPLLHGMKRGWYISILEDPDELFLVAEDSGQVVGILNATIEDESTDRTYKQYRRLSVDEISVSPDYQGTGIGTALLKKAEEWGKEKKTTQTVAIIYAFNDRSLDFFKKQGYEPYSIRLRKIKS